MELTGSQEQKLSISGKKLPTLDIPTFGTGIRRHGIIRQPVTNPRPKPFPRGRPFMPVIDEAVMRGREIGWVS